MYTSKRPEDMNDLEKEYLKNKARRSLNGNHFCSKCEHQIKVRDIHGFPGELYYRDVMSNKPAHITCPAKKSKTNAEEVAA